MAKGGPPGWSHTLTLAPLSPGNPGPGSSTATYKHNVIGERCVCHRGMEGSSQIPGSQRVMGSETTWSFWGLH